MNKQWRYCGWMAPWDIPTWWNTSWYLGAWWNFSHVLGCDVESLCILGFCFEWPDAHKEKE